MKWASIARLAQAALLAALVAHGCAAAARTRSTIEFCNVGNTELSLVTVGDEPRGGWAIDGWQTIQAGMCLKVEFVFHLKVGFAIEKSDGRKGMQVYDQSILPVPFPIDALYCVDPAQSFHHQRDTLLALGECEAGEMLARFAFNFMPIPGDSLSVHIPADQNGDIFPFQQANSAATSFPPFSSANGFAQLDASFAIAMRGLAEQQERVGFRIERQDEAPGFTWNAFYFRDLGIVARPETHAVSVAGGSPAHKAGIRGGDEILRIDEVTLQSAWHARSLLVRTRPGELHTITFWHNAEVRTKEIKLDALPADLALTELHPKQGWLGIEFESAARVVAAIYQDGMPHLELGDDIMKIGRSDFDGVDGLARWLARDVDAGVVELQVRRKSTGRIIVMVLDKLK